LQPFPSGSTKVHQIIDQQKHGCHCQPGEAKMNQNEIGSDTFSRTATVVGSKLAVLVATMAFWLILIALISSPAWLPMLVETLVQK